MQLQNLPKFILVLSKWRFVNETKILENNFSLKLSRFEANFGQQTVVFTFKCSGMVGDVCPTKVTRKGNRMEIVI